VRSLVAGAVFACALASVFHVYLGADLRRAAPTVEAASAGDPAQPLLETDQRFVIWLVGRNAWSLLHRPLEIFDAEPCFPERDTLALGEPGITLGIVGIPAWLATGDPVATYDAVVVALSLIAALSMFWLVRDWTGVSAAGIAAGILFGFHHAKLWEVVHPYVFDNAWTALALLFAVRFFEGRRWRDALGLAGACSLQLAGSLYPTLAATCLALPMLAWLAWRNGLRGQRPLRWLAALALVAAVAAFVFAPYLARRAEGVLEPRAGQVFLGWRTLFPGGPNFPGFVLLGLAALGVAFGHSRFRGGLARDVRWPLLAGALLALALATGGNRPDAALRDRALPRLLPNPYAWLAAVVPGLDTIRGPYTLYSGTQLALCVLAGLGCARLVRAAPKGTGAVAVAAAVVLAAYLDTLRPASLGFEPRLRYRMADRAPPAEAVAFYRTLEELGDRGPVAEAPLGKPGLRQRSFGVLLSAYHHRRSWACLPSYRPPSTHRVVDLLRAVPHPGAVRELADLGFATLVVYHERERPLSDRLRRAVESLAEGPQAPLARIHATERISAYSLRGGRPPPSESAAEPDARGSALTPASRRPR
jgi:hypothetical protein